MQKKLGLSRLVVSALLYPRPHGKKGTIRHADYSGPAVTIERVSSLIDWHATASDVAEAVGEWDDLGLSDLRAWLSGWRPADQWLPRDLKRILIKVGADLVFYSCPDGLRSTRSTRPLGSFHCNVSLSWSRPEVLQGFLKEDLVAASGDWRAHADARFALPLSETERLLWGDIIAARKQKRRKTVDVRITHQVDAAAIVFDLV